jgi:hypothetical protein
VSPYTAGIGASKAGLDLGVAAICPAQLLECLLKRRHSGLSFPIVGTANQHADPPHPLRLLLARRERPRGSRAADQRDELTALQLIELHSMPASQTRIVRYRIGEAASWRKSAVRSTIWSS